MASSAAEIRPPVEDSATAMVSRRAFRRAAMVSARGKRSFMVAVPRMNHGPLLRIARETTLAGPGSLLRRLLRRLAELRPVVLCQPGGDGAVLAQNSVHQGRRLRAGGFD